MQDAGFIDEKTQHEAEATRPKIAHDLATPGAGYFVDFALSQVPGFAGSYTEPLIVQTTLDLDAQQVGEVIQSMAAEAGFEIKLVAVESAAELAGATGAVVPNVP